MVLLHIFLIITISEIQNLAILFNLLIQWSRKYLIYNFSTINW